MNSSAPIVDAMDELIEFLLTRPTLEEVANFHASEALQLRLRYLLDVNRNGRLTVAENAELDRCMQINQFGSILKAREHLKILEINGACSE